MEEVNGTAAGAEMVEAVPMSVVETQVAAGLDLVVSSFNLGTLTTNARAILDAVKAKLELYKSENYSEANIGDAKKDKAKLNAAAKNLNDKRLEYERKFMEPFEEFKGVVNETCGLIKTASAAIDVIVKDVENREREAKLGEIERFFNSLKFELVGLEQIFNPQWLNKGTKMQVIEAEIRERLAKIDAELKILDRLGEPEARVQYLSTLSLDRALAEADRIKENRKRLEAAEKARAEAEAARAEMAPAAVDDEPVPQTPEQWVNSRRSLTAEELLGDDSEPTLGDDEPVAAPAAAAPEDPIFEFTLRFRGPKSKLAALRVYIDANGIEYEKL